MSVILQSPFKLRVNAQKVTKERRVQETTTRVALSKQFQDLIEPSQAGFFRNAFHELLRAMLMSGRGVLAVCLEDSDATLP